MTRTLGRLCGRSRVSYDSEALPGLSRSVTNGETDVYDCKQQKLIHKSMLPLDNQASLLVVLS
jgi:hypothetical protein